MHDADANVIKQVEITLNGLYDPIEAHSKIDIIIFGYLRSVNHEHQIIPKDVYHLCCHYLLPNNVFVTFMKVEGKWKENDQIDIKMWRLQSNAKTNTKSKPWKNKESEILPLDTTSVFRQKVEQFIHRSTMGICVGLNVPLPPKINALLNSNGNPYKNTRSCYVSKTQGQ